MQTLIRKKKINPRQLKFNIGDQVAFKLEKKKFVGKIIKAYKNSFLVTFHSDDASIVDKYHNRTVINDQDLKVVKSAKKSRKRSRKQRPKNKKSQKNQKS